MQTASNSELATKFTVLLTPHLLLPPTCAVFQQPNSKPAGKFLKSAQLRNESAIQCTSDLKLNYLSVERVAARRTELCWMQELIFCAEVNAKRAATIKNKTYPQLKRKMLAKLEVDPSDGEGRE
jgi:U3 small nucleolar RNA-associated protein 14